MGIQAHVVEQRSAGNDRTWEPKQDVEMISGAEFIP